MASIFDKVSEYMQKQQKAIDDIDKDTSKSKPAPKKATGLPDTSKSKLDMSDNAMKKKR